MNQEDKQLSLKDLCVRLKSNLICKVTYKDSDGWKEEDMVLSGIIDDEGYFTSENGSIYSCEFKPYLRPMSSMTEEEKKELKSSTCPFGTGYFDEKYLICPMSHYGEQISYEFMSGILDWLNAHHFDYHGLIEKGLAIAVTKENNPYKE